MTKENNINTIVKTLCSHKDNIYNITLFPYELKKIIESNLKDDIKIKLIRINGYLDLLVKMIEKDYNE